MYLSEGEGLVGAAGAPGYMSRDANDTSFGGRRRKRRRDDAGGVDDSALGVMDGTATRGSLNVDPRRVNEPTEQGFPAAPKPNAVASAISTPTFSELRTAGRARPAPPQFNNAGMLAAQQAAIARAQQPSRYDTAAMQDAMRLFDARLASQGAESRRTLDEQASARGLFDSNVALDASRKLEENLGNQRAQFANDQLRERAAIESQDNTAALNALFGLASQQRQQFDADRNYERDIYNDDMDLLNKQYGLGLDRDRLTFNETGQNRDQLIALLKLFGDPSVALTAGG